MFAHFILACGAAVVSARAVVEVDAKGGYGNQLFEFGDVQSRHVLLVRRFSHKRPSLLRPAALGLPGLPAALDQVPFE